MARRQRWRSLGLLVIWAWVCAPALAGQESGTSKIDENQERMLRMLEKMFGKLHGLQGVPEEAREHVRGTVFMSLNAAHRPDRAKSDKLANDVMDLLRRKEIRPSHGHRVVADSAVLLGEETLTKEGRDHLFFEFKKMFQEGGVPKDAADRILADVDQLLKTAKKNEEYLADRAAAREAEQEAQAEKEAKKKEEEERRAQKGKNRKGRLGFKDLKKK